MGLHLSFRQEPYQFEDLRKFTVSYNT